MADNQIERRAPVEILNTGSPEDDDPRNASAGIALCLSGGGYRAMLFHLGSLWRLNEFGYLPKLTRISSVSGGSIVAGILGLTWNRLAFDPNGVATNFEAELVPPIRAMAGKTIDDASIIGGIFTPGSIADQLTDAYRKHLFGAATLQDLPDAPEFVINATSVQTGALFRFLKAYMADYRVGRVRRPKLELAVAVAASSAFPPVLSPLRLELDASDWAPPSRLASEDLHREPYLTDVVLTDGGVYDNLGLETAWKKFRTILVSNGGGKLQPEPDPKGDWARHAMRINEVIDNQVRSLRVRQVIGAFEAEERSGTYWSIRADIASYATPQALPCPVEQTIRLAEIKTRLKRLDAAVQERLVNWGYAITDAAMRRWVEPRLAAPPGFPYAAAGIG
jgi:NTE family protein